MGEKSLRSFLFRDLLAEALRTSPPASLAITQQKTPLVRGFSSCCRGGGK